MQPWVEKYRPETPDGVVAHEPIVRALRELVRQNRLPHLIFHGRPGTGKTTLVRALTRELFGAAAASHVLELNASDDSGIDVIRQAVKGFVGSGSIVGGGGGLKLVVLDECDHMSSAAQAALRRLMETSIRHARFCLLCNYPERLLPAILSRCAAFRFLPVPRPAALAMLQRIAAAEGMQIDAGALGAVAAVTEGDMRQAINVLQSLQLFAADSITVRDVYKITAKPAPEVGQALLDKMPYGAKYDQVRACMDAGSSLEDMLCCVFRALFQVELETSRRAAFVRELALVEEALALGAPVESQVASFVSLLCKY